jgi:Cu/Zn superoxide dismutase
MGAAQAQAPTYIEASLDPFSRDNQATGSVRIDQEGSQLTMSADLRKLTAGKYSLSIHENGDCGDNSKKAGDVIKGGDLGTVTADEKGTGQINHSLPGLSFNLVNGKAVVLSQNGKPLACGILLPPQPPPPPPPAL